jgi:hypothetical protein
LHNGDDEKADGRADEPPNEARAALADEGLSIELRSPHR